MQQKHEEKLQRLSKAIKRHYQTRTPFKVFHGSTNSTRILSFKRSEMVDVSDFNEVLAINKDNQTIVVEPNVAMDMLVKATLRHGLIPPVIPEFPGITVGGAIQGGAGESSSFKWGFLSQTVNWIEMVLADGTVVRCSPSEHADLFYGSAGACGTLGVITAAEVQLMPAKEYVQLTYLPVTSFEMANTTMRTLSDEPHDFIDCIMYSADRGVIITGALSNTATGSVRRFTRAIDQWYYLHVAKIVRNGSYTTESVPIVDYLFRYDRGAFWVGRFAFERFGIPFNRFSRFLLNPLLHTRELYKALQDSGASQEHIVQDLTVPFDAATDFMNYIDSTTGIYPLWICPIKPEPRSPLICNGLNTPLAMNIGVWGPRIPNYEDFVAANRQLEKTLSRAGGKKWMYAHSYYTADEFWKVYDKNWYDNLRNKYNAATLPDFYQKTSVNKRVTVNARRGLVNTIFGKAKLAIKD